MKILLFLSFAVIVKPAFATSQAIVCKATLSNQNIINQALENLKNDELFKLGESRSAYKTCIVNDEDVMLLFANGDQLTLTLSEIAPGTELILAEPSIKVVDAKRVELLRVSSEII